ncbi:MAG: hypothetical protein A2Y10_19945 [Planctomycetes bacterium GWF2_41_51]|nr:MAG: hypothetical protein A2Y10_19945 [Planctomycetes bacterium GWF2_41_51]HBG28558.1 hypothetical protein [Phycisphaerales bacterium]
MVRAKSKKLSRYCGFTLVELLVVISIIAMLLAVLMPALQKARAVAVSVMCKTNLKDIGVIMNCYSQDYGCIPPSSESGNRWMLALSKYHYKRKANTIDDPTGGAKAGGIYDFSLFRCPYEQKKTGKTDGTSLVELGAAGIYGLNQYFTGYCFADNVGSVMKIPGEKKEDMKYTKLIDIISPGTFPFMADTSTDDPFGMKRSTGAIGCWWLSAKGPHPNALEKYKWTGGKKGDVTTWSPTGPAPNHQGKTNYLMGDFHVATMGLWPWRDNIGTDFHPKRKPPRAGP